MSGQTSSGLYVETRGDAEQTIVFIPGLGGTTRYWQQGMDSPAGDVRVVLLDLLGFGQSPKPWTRYTVERQLTEIERALRPFGRVTLVGHSLGALIAVAYAARHTNQVDNIVLIGMPYFGSEEKAYKHLRSGAVKWGFLYTNVLLAMITCILTRRVFGWLLPRLLPDIPTAVAQDLVKHTWRSSTSSLWEVVYRYDAAADLYRLPQTMGVLMIHGTEDDVAPLSAIRELVSNQPNWHLAILDGIDHHPFLRDPATCLQYIRSLASGEAT